MKSSRFFGHISKHPDLISVCFANIRHPTQEQGDIFGLKISLQDRQDKSSEFVALYVRRHNLLKVFDNFWKRLFFIHRKSSGVLAHRTLQARLFDPKCTSARATFRSLKSLFKTSRATMTSTFSSLAASAVVRYPRSGSSKTYSSFSVSCW